MNTFGKKCVKYTFKNGESRPNVMYNACYLFKIFKLYNI